MPEKADVSRRLAGRIKRSGLKSKLKMFLIVAVVVFGVISFFWGEYGIFRLWLLNKKIEKLDRTIQVLQVQRQDILWETEKMKNDPAYIQKYAVETYGYARPEQKVIQFVQADTSATAKAQVKQVANTKSVKRK